MLLDTSLAQGYCVNLHRAYSAHISFQRSAHRDFGAYEVLAERVSGQYPRPQAASPLPFVTRAWPCLSCLWVGESRHCWISFLLPCLSSRHHSIPWSQNSCTASCVSPWVCACLFFKDRKRNSPTWYFPPFPFTSLPYIVHSVCSQSNFSAFLF